MKRYLVFAGAAYYPWGGWQDFKGDFDTVEAATEFAKACDPDTYKKWYQVVDTTLPLAVDLSINEDTGFRRRQPLCIIAKEEDG